jgi:hypothetical protein
MKQATQLKIDLAYNNYDEVIAFYNAIQKLNENSEFGVEILDDGNSPYTEDMTEQYKQCGVLK